MLPAQPAANLLTPWLGVEERITIYSYLLWVVLSIVLLRAEKDQAQLTAAMPKGAEGRCKSECVPTHRNSSSGGF